MGGAEYVVRQIPNEYKYKNDWMEQHAEEVETLILGNSHTELGLCPETFGDHCFNLAISGRTPKYDEFMLEKWADRFRNLKLVIMPISYFSFFYKEPLGMNNGPTLYKIYFDYPEHSDYSLYNIETLFFKGVHAKVHSYLNNIVKYDEKGWVEASLDLKDSLYWENNETVKVILNGTTARSDTYVEENYNYVCNMAVFCKSRCIRLVFISTPIWHTYSNRMDKKQLATTYSKMTEIQKKFGIEFYDYRDDQRFVDDDFIDVQHLSSKGARKFSNILLKDHIVKEVNL